MLLFALSNFCVQKYNQGSLTVEEEKLLEKYIEQGWIELEELEDILVV